MVIVSDMARRMEAAIEDARSAVRLQEKELAAQAEWIGRDMTRLAVNVTGDSTLNSLGEIQGRGSALDVKVAALCATRDFLAKLLWIAGWEQS
jgi:hypothetical protein